MARGLVLAALAVSIAAASAASAGEPAPRPVTVEIRAMKYSPDSLTVAVGTKVTWVNRDEMPHTVTDRGRSFASAALDTGESYSYTFETPGEFTYYCTVHPFMTAKVRVRPAGS